MKIELLKCYAFFNMMYVKFQDIKDGLMMINVVMLNRGQSSNNFSTEHSLI